MGYVEHSLMPGERVRYQTRLHWIIFLPATALALLLAILVVVALSAGSIGLAFVIVLIGALAYVPSVIRYVTSEFAITDRRVIIKVGLVRRNTLEMLLGKVENIAVSQPIIGRAFGFGSVQITGTGGTQEPFANIRDPLEFRRQAQVQITDHQQPRASSPSVEVPDSRTAQASSRAERECPYCAEIILAKARVCKHCGRDVQPV